jgi:lysophospholipase L1-like esterase
MRKPSLFKSRFNLRCGIPASLFGFVVLSAFPLAVCRAQSAAPAEWVGTWAASPMLAGGGFSMRPFAGTTLREVVHISTGGDQVRVRFTNEFGIDPLTINDVHVALSAGAGAIQPGSDHALTFGGAAGVRIAPGAAVFSDPVALAAAPLSDLAISFYIPNQILRAETIHSFGDQDNFSAEGDVAGAATLSQPSTFSSWYFLSGVEVPATAGSRAIVTFGDSITDGAHSTANANRRWPDVLAARLQQQHGLEHVSVLNEGIGGNRVLNEVAGPSALSRFDRDVLAQDGVKYLIILESINDIGHLARPTGPEDVIDAAQLEFGLRQMIDAAHAHGIKVYGATLTPYAGANYDSDKGEQIRGQVNDWIRSSGVFDGVIDFDKMTRDPANPTRFLPADDSGDHLHPGDDGYKAMGGGIDLNLFAK